MTESDPVLNYRKYVNNIVGADIVVQDKHLEDLYKLPHVFDLRDFISISHAILHKTFPVRWKMKHANWKSGIRRKYRDNGLVNSIGVRISIWDYVYLFVDHSRAHCSLPLVITRTQSTHLHGRPAALPHCSDSCYTGGYNPASHRRTNGRAETTWHANWESGRD